MSFPVAFSPFDGAFLLAETNGEGLFSGPNFFFALMGVCLIMIIVGAITDRMKKNKQDKMPTDDADDEGFVVEEPEEEEELEEIEPASDSKADKKRAKEEAKARKKQEKEDRKRAKAEAKAQKKAGKKKGKDDDAELTELTPLDDEPLELE